MGFFALLYRPKETSETNQVNLFPYVNLLIAFYYYHESWGT
jgi:hypothetical protein